MFNLVMVWPCRVLFDAVQVTYCGTVSYLVT
jgi:hypothetical protein